VAACEAAARAHPLRAALWQTALHRGMRALLEGRFEEGERFVQEALAIGQGLHPETAMLAFGVQMATLFWYQGRMAEIEDSLGALAARYPAIAGFRWSLAFLAAELGREAEAREAYARLAADDFADLPCDALWLATLHLVTESCVFLRDERRAAILYDLLLPFAERSLMHGFGVVCWGSAARLLGLLATLLGCWEDAERHYELAARWNRRLRARPQVALVQRDHAAMLLQRGGPGDRQKALGLLAEALATAQELGMKPTVERALALKLRAQGVAPHSMNESIDAIVSFVERERPDLRAHAAPDGTVTILFTDLEGSTAMTERLGDGRAQQVLHRHNRIVREQVRAHGGFEVKSQGDGFMLAFQSACKALRCAIALERAFAARNEARSEEALRVRIGLHTGEPIRETDDFFGKAVNQAARIAAEARGGEILVSALLRELTESSGEFTFSDARQVALRGLSGSHEVFSVAWAVPEGSP
jgi:eukaryotic-like serine/threonine-protein kinase